MADIRHVSDGFSVAPQITAADFAEIAAAGFRAIINNRPDGEAPGQIGDADAQAAAAAAGLRYIAIPVRGAPGPAEVEATVAALASLPGPILAYCRSGTRSVTAWALAQARSGGRADDVIDRARGAGYDLNALRSAFAPST